METFKISKGHLIFRDKNGLKYKSELVALRFDFGVPLEENWYVQRIIRRLTESKFKGCTCTEYEIAGDLPSNT